MNGEQDEGSHAHIQERFLAAILAFPARLDVMETRDEDACRKLAFRLAELAEKEFEGRTAGC